MEFELGDKVTVIDEELSGTIIKIEGDWVSFHSEDGFDYKYPKELLYAIGNNNELKFTSASFNLEIKEEDLPKKAKGLKPIKLTSAKPTIDLHMEELLPGRQLKRNEIAIQIQLEYAESVINKAMSLKIRQLVFIHGMGSGILRDELRSMIRAKFPNVEYLDGNYQKYGQGATELIIHGLGSI